MPIIAPGYFLTWHTYGTWLHGDDGGSVDHAHNRFKTPRLPPDPARLNRELRALKNPPLTLSHTARILVDTVMRKHCALRSWSLRALAVRSNHIHVVIANPTVEPKTIVRELKSWGTRTLRAHRIVGPRELVWTDHASTLYLYETGAVEEKTHYVLTMQDNRPPADGHGREDWDVKYGLSTTPKA